MFVLLLTFSAFLTKTRGDATNLAIINLTPYDLVESHDPRSYQMTHWNDAFPQAVKAKSFTSAYIEIEVGLNEEADDAGEFYYSLSDGSDNTIKLALDVSGSITNYDINLNADLTGISTVNNPESAPIGFRDNGDADKETWTPFIIAGDATSGYIGNNPPDAWMTTLLPFIGCQTLQQLTIPGTHDSGMSKVQYSTTWSWASNTITQELDVLDQLSAGARYLDIRPIISHGDYYTGHYDKTDQAGWQGSAGQSIAEVIDNINAFTASNSELVIVYLSHSANTDTDYGPFDDDEWNSCLYRFYQGLNSLWKSETTDPLTSISLSDFISGGAAVVIVVDERDQAYLDQMSYTGRGIFPKSAFPQAGTYANSDDMNKVREDLYTKLLNFNASPGQDEVFVLSWTITLQGGENIDPLDHITTRANILNNHLAEVDGQSPYNSPFLWGSGDTMPNMILIDNIGKDKDLVALAAAFNRYYSTC